MRQKWRSLEQMESCSFLKTKFLKASGRDKEETLFGQSEKYEIS